jgi:hypothetical protein
MVAALEQGVTDRRLASAAFVAALAVGPLVALGGMAAPVLVATAVLGVAVLRHPPLAAYAYIASMPLLVGMNRGELLPVPLLRPNEAVLFLVLGVVLARRLWDVWDRPAVRVRLHPVDVWVLAFAAGTSLWPLASMLARGVTITEGDVLYALAMWKYVAVYALIRAVITTPRDVARCLWVSMGAAAVAAVIGVLQALQLFGVTEVLAAYYAPEQEQQLVDINRGTSTVASSIAMADVMVFHLTIAVAWLVRGGRPRWLLGGLALTFLLGALATGQFSGFLGLVVGVVAVALVTGHVRRIIVPALPAIGVGLLLVGPVVQRRLAGFADGGLPSSWEVRLENLQTHFWPELRDPVNLLLGVRAEARVPAPQWWDEWIWIESGHTWLLWVGGVPLLAVFVALTLVGGRAAWRIGRRRTDAVGVAAAAAFAAVVVVFVLMAFDPHITMRGAADTFFVILALALTRRTGVESEPHGARPVRRVDVRVS